MDLLNLAAEERVNLSDLSFGLTDSIVGPGQDLAQGLLLPAATGGASVVAGFVPRAAASGGPVTVGQGDITNCAFLSRIDSNGVVTPACLIYGGTSVVSIDISTFPTNSYGIFIRATRSAQTVQNRAFWSGVDASEYAQLTPTRLTTSWEMRIETATPGPEWLRIGTAAVTAAGSGGQGATVVVTDTRPLLFEGSAASSYAPTWGTAADRSARQTATITSLGQMVDALKQSIVDIKGRGLQPWYSPNIGGLLVGGAFALADTPTNNRIAVGDKLLYLDLSGDIATLNLGGVVGAAAIRYSRSGANMSISCGTSAARWVGDGSISAGDIFTNPAQSLLGVQSHTPWVGEFSSDASTGGSASLSSVNSDAGGNLFFRRYASTTPDPTNGSWFWRVRGYADTNQTYFRIGGTTSVGGVTPLAVSYPRVAGLSSVTTLAGGQLYLQGDNIYMVAAGQTKPVYPGIFPYVAGQVQSAKSDGVGTAGGSSWGATTGVSYSRPDPNSTGGRKVFRAAFGSLPANFVVVANVQRYSSAGDDQTGFSVTYTNIGGAQIEFCLTDDSGDSEWGSFSYVVFSAT